MRLRTGLATLALAFAPLALAAQPAEAAPQPWHIKNSVNSTRFANIYGETNCTGSQTILYVGDSAQSTGWEGMRVYGNDWVVKVYSGTTGSLLATRTYSGGVCVRAYTTNDYLITAP